MELTMEHVIGINKGIQEVNEDADTVRKRDKLEFIVQRINHMLKNKEDEISILAYILHAIPTEQPFNNGNHRTAYSLFYEYCFELGKSSLADNISLRDEAFIRFLEFLTISQLERELRKISLQSLK